MSHLHEAPGAPTSPNLVYTSAGDHGNVDRWVAGVPAFDLWITYYGHRQTPDLPPARYFNRRAGSKFQNLHHAWQTWRDRLERYDHVFVLDDDMILSAPEINRLFETAATLGTAVLQPAFDPRGKISHGVTRVQAGTAYRHVDLIEVAAPLFKADRLWDFLGVYDPRLTGHGIDWWYGSHLGFAGTRCAAVIDEIVALNPHDRAKGGEREIEKAAGFDERVALWRQIRKERGLPRAIRGRDLHREPLRGARYVMSHARVGWMEAAAFPRHFTDRMVRRHPLVRKVKRKLRKGLRSIRGG